MNELTAVSLFAGIEGFGLALERCGVRVTAAVEIDPDCRGVIARHFPQTALFSDVKEVTGDQLRAAGFVPEHGILTGGFPCQDLSIAGRRAGLGGARSGLFWHIVRLAREMRPQWLLLENVPGLLSAVCSCPGDDTCTGNGRAVRCGRWDKRDGKRVWLACVPHIPKGGACPGGCMERHGGAMGTVLGALGNLGYGFAYRVLDAQFFGVPQRRERVFIAGRLGDRAAPVEVLLEPEGGAGHSAARGTARADVAGTLGSRVGGSRTTDLDGHGAYVVSSLQGGGQRGHRVDAEGAAGGHLITVPVAVRGREGGSQIEAGEDGDPSFTVRTPGGGSSVPMVAYALTSRNDRNDREENWIVSPFASQRVIAHALTSEGADASEDGTGRGTPLVPVFAPLTANPQTGGSKARLGYSEIPTALGCTQITAVQTTTGVRRLTPKECERLQGFPDDWTRWQARGERDIEQSDSARYRQCGNAVAVPVVEWVARRIVAVSAALSVAEAAA